MIQTVKGFITDIKTNSSLVKQKHKNLEGDGWYAGFVNSSINFQLVNDFTFTSDAPFFLFLKIKSVVNSIIREFEIDNFGSVG